MFGNTSKSPVANNQTPTMEELFAASQLALQKRGLAPLPLPVERNDQGNQAIIADLPMTTEDALTLSALTGVKYGTDATASQKLVTDKIAHSAETQPSPVTPLANDIVSALFTPSTRQESRIVTGETPDGQVAFLVIASTGQEVGKAAATALGLANDNCSMSADVPLATKPAVAPASIYSQSQTPLLPSAVIQDFALSRQESRAPRRKKSVRWMVAALALASVPAGMIGSSVAGKAAGEYVFVHPMCNLASKVPMLGASMNWEEQCK